jgi:hypothetical protein
MGTRPANMLLQLPRLLAITLLATIPATAPAAGSKSGINSDRVLVINGQKVFSIGFTMPPPPDGKTPAGKNGIAELADAGATFLRTGAREEGWNDAGFRREQQYLDAAERYGMHCMPFLREDANLTSDAREAQLRKILNRFKDHPGLGAWKGEDEPEWGKVPLPGLGQARQVIRELDPNHPVVIIHAPRGTVESLRPYNAIGDILGADIYPISYPPGIHSLLTNRSLSLVGDHTRIMMETAGGKLPVWMVLQISWSGVLQPGKTLRFPTFAEERFMTYEAIINGARGLIFFGGNNLGGMSPADRKLGWNWTFWKRVLRPVIEEIGSKSPLYPALVAPDSQLQIQITGDGISTQARSSRGHQFAQTSSSESQRGLTSAATFTDKESSPRSGVEFCVREAGDRLFVIACKREGPTAKVEFSGLPRTAAEGELMFESPRRVQAKEGKFSDWFAPFEAHVYEFKLN